MYADIFDDTLMLNYDNMIFKDFTISYQNSGGCDELCPTELSGPTRRKAKIE